MKTLARLTPAIGLLLAGWTVLPASATHIQEPTTPVTGLNLRVWEYGNQSSIVDCSVVADVTFENLRVDGFVLAAGAPSEHFTVQGAVYKLNTPAGTVAASRAKWAHQNAPPHAPVSVGWYGFFMDQPNLGQHRALESGGGLSGGLWRVVVMIVGQESGASFTQTCTFRKVAA